MKLCNLEYALVIALSLTLPCSTSSSSAGPPTPTGFSASSFPAGINGDESGQQAQRLSPQSSIPSAVNYGRGGNGWHQDGPVDAAKRVDISDDSAVTQHARSMQHAASNQQRPQRSIPQQQMNDPNPTRTQAEQQKQPQNILFGSDLSQVDKDVIFEGLKNLYRRKILPLEVATKYSHFGSPPLGPSDFESKPMVVIVGQYSVGKTSFIRSLVKKGK
jgi:hypothetical protein